MSKIGHSKWQGEFSKVEIEVEIVNTKERIPVNALIDLGATSLYINKKFVIEKGWKTKKLEGDGIPVYNVDRTLNQNGQITEFVQLQMTIQDHKKSIEFRVTNLRKTDIFIRFKWLKTHNSTID